MAMPSQKKWRSFSKGGKSKLNIYWAVRSRSNQSITNWWITVNYVKYFSNLPFRASRNLCHFSCADIVNGKPTKKLLIVHLLFTYFAEVNWNNWPASATCVLIMFPISNQLKRMFRYGKGIADSIVGIYGLGRIGRSIAEKLSAFKPAKIIYNDIKPVHKGLFILVVWRHLGDQILNSLKFSKIESPRITRSRTF